MSLESFYNNKVVLITGGYMGIGKELARQVLSYGGKVAITGRNGFRLKEVLEEFHIDRERIMIYEGDVAIYENNECLIEKIIGYFGRLDVVINNAGMSAYGDLQSVSKIVINEMIDTNIKGSIFCSKASFSELSKTNGSILFISSIAAFRGLPDHSLYSLTKMALTALVQSLRIECIRTGIFVGLAYVGFTENEENKIRLSADGEKEFVPKRNPHFVQSRQSTAKKLLSQIARKVPYSTHSVLGNISALLAKFFPLIANAMITWNYYAQKRRNKSING